MSEAVESHLRDGRSLYRPYSEFAEYGPAGLDRLSAEAVPVFAEDPWPLKAPEE